jgi:hypothetical protein
MMGWEEPLSQSYSVLMEKLMASAGTCQTND